MCGWWSTSCTATCLADPARYDGICLDVDNGPGWLVHSANAALYAEPGLALLWERLRPGGRLAVWAAAEDEDFERRLRARFDSVEIVRVPVPRGPDDVIYVGLRPAQEPG